MKEENIFLLCGMWIDKTMYEAFNLNTTWISKIIKWLDTWFGFLWETSIKNRWKKNWIKRTFDHLFYSLQIIVCLLFEVFYIVSVQFYNVKRNPFIIACEHLFYSCFLFSSFFKIEWKKGNEVKKCVL